MSRFVYKKVSNKVSFLNYNKNSKPIEEQKENKTKCQNSKCQIKYISI